MNFLVTGGRGFIGSHFVERVLKEGHRVTDVDCMTYAANYILPFDNNPNYRHIKQNIAYLTIDLFSIDIIVNFAAETHVDNSISQCRQFLYSNIIGVSNLLEILIESKHKPLYVQISTDEVYGSSLIQCSEKDSLNPSNPYSATKASAEHLVTSFANTYGIEYLITRSTNNYGPRQNEEKLIPKAIKKAKENQPIPIYGDGTHMRDWIRVEDNVDAIYHLIMGGHRGIFNISAQNLLSSTEVASKIIEELKSDSKIEYVTDRPGHDFCYSVSNCKLYNTGWRPKYIDFNLDWINN